MSDYYLEQKNKTFFLSGSLIYHTNNSGSNADKNDKTLINYDYMLQCFNNTQDGSITISTFMEMTNQVSGSINYFFHKGVL